MIRNFAPQRRSSNEDEARAPKVLSIYDMYNMGSFSHWFCVSAVHFQKKTGGWKPPTDNEDDIMYGLPRIVTLKGSVDPVTLPPFFFAYFFVLRKSTF